MKVKRPLRLQHRDRDPDDEPEDLPEDDDESPAEEPEEDVPPAPPPKPSGGLSAESDRALKKKLRLYTEEFHLLAADSSAAAMNRRLELTRLLRGVQDVLDAREELVEITVPRSVTGEPFQIGPATFPPGVHRVRASVARYLLWLIGENQRIEMNRLKSNGREINLGTIGSRARMATIARDDGRDDFVGRGS
jgi:hypothetical protein